MITARHAVVAGSLLIAFQAVVAEEVKFFRIRGPTNTEITSLSLAGILSWTNDATVGTNCIEVSSFASDTNWKSYVEIPVTSTVQNLQLYDPAAPKDMVLIPGGTFAMGDCMNDPTYSAPLFELPVHKVYVSPFYMERYEVTMELWQSVRNWALTNGYDLFNAAGNAGFDGVPFDYIGKTNHPIINVNRNNALKWCNARSEKEGLQPCYFTADDLTTVYRAGVVEMASSSVRWDVNGYRLPTEAEWEKASRGGAVGHRYPWDDADTITHARANYCSLTNYAYDVSPTRGPHPTYAGAPYGAGTSPVGSFAPNGYGLYDMTGNVIEWCWDRWGFYNTNDVVDPRGPYGTGFSTYAVRGGSWNSILYPHREQRCAFRFEMDGEFRSYWYGFRCVRSTK